MKKRVFSGIQPSGLVHIGNYIGALKNWVEMQDTYDCVYCIVDLHAITVPQDPKELHQSILRTAAITMAVGVDPSRSVLFVQSDVAAHSELQWILNCFVYFGELSRMTQFKDKSTQRGVGTSSGLFTYPILMAADILLYDTQAVPVGEDQKQHLELSRLVARRMNNQFPDLFVVPEPFIVKHGARIMGLDDPTAKMSKSASSEQNFISLVDTPDEIRKKFKRAVTDSGSEVQFDEEKKPAVSNLLSIYSAMTNQPVEEIVARYAGRGYGDFKKELAEAVIETLAPIQKRIQEFESDPGQLEKILSDGASKAAAIAEGKLSEVKKRLGLGRK